MSIGKGIKLSTGFDLNSQFPLDNREVFETIAERDSLPNINLYEGLMCYVKETKQNYQYIDGAWSDFKSGGNAVERIAYGNIEPISEDVLLWIDTSEDEGNENTLSDTLALEIKDTITNLNNRITALEEKVAYLEQYIAEKNI